MRDFSGRVSHAVLVGVPIGTMAGLLIVIAYIVILVRRYRSKGMCKARPRLDSVPASDFLQEFENRCPAEQDDVWQHIQAAREIAVFAPAALPDVLRTPAYARCLLEGDTSLTQPEIEQHLSEQARRRQAVLHGHVALRVFISLSALMTDLGDKDLQCEQWEHLLSLSLSRRNEVTIRVVPDGFAITSGFTLLSGNEGELVICSTGNFSGRATLLLEQSAHVAAYQEILNNAAELSWTVGKSKSFLAELSVRDQDDMTEFEAAALVKRLGIDENER